MADYTTTALVADVKITGMVPTIQPLVTDAQIITAMDQELHNELAPVLMGVMEEYFVTSSDIAVTTGTESYPIPQRAVGAKLRGVFWVNSSGGLLHIPRRTLKDSRTSWPLSNAPFSGYYIQGNTIRFFPQAIPSGTIRVYYYRRVSALVAESAAAEVTAVNTTTNKATVTTYPSSWTTGTVIDSIQGFPHFDNVWTGKAIIGITGAGPYDIEVDDVGDLAVGDWLALEDESPIPQIPLEGHVLLTLATASTLLRQFADGKGVELLDQEYARKLQNFTNIINARVDSDAKTIVPDGIGRSANRYYPWRV